MRDVVEPELLTLSDVLVMNALSRAYSRGLPRNSRNVPAERRWRAYEQFAVPEAKFDSALNDAWAMVPSLINRYHLDVVEVDWVGLLDSYTRSLLMMSIAHTRKTLADQLIRLDRQMYPTDAEIEQEEREEAELAARRMAATR